MFEITPAIPGFLGFDKIIKGRILLEFRFWEVFDLKDERMVEKIERWRTYWKNLLKEVLKLLWGGGSNRQGNGEFEGFCSS